MTPNYAAALDFYRSTFHLDSKVMGDSDEFRYSALVPAGGGDEVAGIMDASAFLPEGSPGQWSVYWDVEDAAAAVAKVRSLGGSVVADVEQTPYGQIATVADPARGDVQAADGTAVAVPESTSGQSDETQLGVACCQSGRRVMMRSNELGTEPNLPSSSSQERYAASTSSCVRATKFHHMRICSSNGIPPRSIARAVVG